MIRKRDRVIGTLMIWVAAVVSMMLAVGRLNDTNVWANNYWYHAGNLVTGATPEEATRIVNELQSIGQGFYTQTRQFAQAEMLAYLPYILLIAAIVLAGALLSTMFIWRSVAVPAEISERIAGEAALEHTHAANESLAHLLDDDGELVDLDSAAAPRQRREQRSS